MDGGPGCVDCLAKKAMCEPLLKTASTISQQDREKVVRYFLQDQAERNAVLTRDWSPLGGRRLVDTPSRPDRT